MQSLPTRRDLRQLLADTGVCLPESSKQHAVWLGLILIHSLISVGFLILLWQLL